MAKRRQKLKHLVCIYCGGPCSSLDHVPPKNLFPQPRPDNMIKVPSCNPCNHGASRDDEYFRMALTLREEVHRHPAAQAVLPAVYRALSNPMQPGFRASLFNTMGRVRRFTPSGLYLGWVPTYEVDMERMERVVARTVKGLYYHERGERLPPSCEVTAHQLPPVPPIGGIDQDMRAVIGHVLAQPTTVVGDNVFSYRVSFFESEAWRRPGDSVWWLEFYGRVPFLAFSESDATQVEIQQREQGSIEQQLKDLDEHISNGTESQT